MKSLPKPLNPIIVSLSRFVNLEDGWAGNDSVAPKLQAIKEAMVFARNLPDRLPKPMVRPAVDGEVNFYWKTENMLVDLDFYGDGTYSYFAQIGKKEWSSDAVSYTELLPSEIIERMK